MKSPTADSPTVAKLNLGLPCRPLREVGAEGAVEVAEIRYVDDGYVALTWIAGDDAPAVVDALGEWDAVCAVDALSAAGESRLLRLELVEDTVVTAGYETLVDHDVLLSQCTATAEGWNIRLTAPSHGALTAVYDRWREIGIDVEIVSVGDETGDSQTDDGVTDSQREALRSAAEAGYFSVPRQATLQEVAERLEVSDQAISERIRRGTDRLVREHVSGADETPVSGAGRSLSEDDDG